MEIKKAIKFVGKQIAALEEGTYLFESVVKPRYEQDKKILDAMREQHLKMMALEEKMAKGEDITQEEVYECVPEQFR